MSTIRKPWSREETLLAVNLYCRIPFGKQHSRCHEVIELATAIGRTPSSVAMKLNNFTSLDPEEQARGVKGLSGASKLDRDIWEEINNNWEKVSAKSEYLWKQVVEQKSPISNLPILEKFSDNTIDYDDISKNWLGSTETTRTTSARLAQGFFRRTVLASYLNRCCISGIPVSELLVASHILPWADHPDQRVNPCNGLCLSNLHDKAFDRGLITFDEEYRLVLGKKLKEFMTVEALRFNFLSYEGKQLTLPEKFLPDKQSLAHHRDAIFCSN
jgi:predicted restriction endonuclease